MDIIITAVSCIVLAGAAYLLARPFIERMRLSKYDPDCPHCQVLMEMDKAKINR